MRQPGGSFDDMSLEALREELAAASAQVARAASTAVDPWDVASGEEDSEDAAAVGGFDSGDGRDESSALGEDQSLDDATPRSIYDEAEQMSGEIVGDGAAGGYSDPNVASLLDPVGSLENPAGQIKTLPEFCTPAAPLASPRAAKF